MIVERGEIDASFGVLLLQACRTTAHAAIEPEHFLIGLLDVPDGALASACRRARPSVDLNALRQTLLKAAASQTVHPPPSANWSERLLSPASRQLLDQAAAQPDFETAPEPHLALAALARSKAPVVRVFQYTGIDPEELKAYLAEPKDQAGGVLAVFDDDGRVNMAAFNAFGKAVLKRIGTEGSGLGQIRIGPPLVLFALVAHEGGALDRGLRIQGAMPRDLHDSLLMHLKGLSKSKRNDEFRLARELMQPAVAQALERAATLAVDRGHDTIGDEEIAAGMLLEDPYFTRGFLESRSVNVSQLSAFLAGPRPADAPSESPEDQPHELPPLPEVIARLRQRIIRQDHVIDALVPFLKRFWFGYRRMHRPLAVLLFLGHSGTGKTQLAKEIARALYGSEEQLLFFEMGQFGTEISKNVFVGAPQGYVGYGEGQLTNGLRDKPESVVLFDEVEKAHPAVFDVLLRFLDEGVISDPAGPVRDGRRCVIILTSNKQIERLQDLTALQMQALTLGRDEQETARTRIRQILIESGLFRREFVNRMDELLLFNIFDEPAYRQILVRELAEEQRRLKDEKRLDVEFGPEVVEALVGECLARQDEGARVCGKLISTSVVPAVIDFFVDETNAGLTAARVTIGPRGHVLVQRKEAAS